MVTKVRNHETTLNEITKSHELPVGYQSKGTSRNAKLSPDNLPEDTRLFTEGEDNLMSCITLQTTTGPEEYQVSELDAVIWWKTQTGINVVGYMDVVSGLMSETDLETCRIKRPEIVHEILEEQAGLPQGHSIH